jgi:hypothetical protein
MPAVGGSNAAPAGNGGGGGGYNDNSIVYDNAYAEIEQRVQNYAATGNYITTDPWQSWNYTYMTNGVMTTSGGNTTWITWNGQYQQDVLQPLTEEQLAERERLRVRYEEVRQQNYEVMRREQEETTRRAQAARARATELLNEMLSDEQRQTREEHGWFAVRGSESGRVYRICGGIVNNVYRLSEDGTVRDQVLCAHPPDIPDEDCHLAQMLLLVTNEPEFVRIANKHGVAGYDAVLPENMEAYRAQREAEREADRQRRRRERDDREARYPVAEHLVEGVEMQPVVLGIDPSFRDGMFVEATDWQAAYIPRHLDHEPVTYNMRVEQAVQRGLAWVDGDVAEQGAALGH